MQRFILNLVILLMRNMPNLYLKDEKYRRILKKHDDVTAFVDAAVEAKLKSEGL